MPSLLALAFAYARNSTGDRAEAMEFAVAVVEKHGGVTDDVNLRREFANFKEEMRRRPLTAAQAVKMLRDVRAADGDVLEAIDHLLPRVVEEEDVAAVPIVTVRGGVAESVDDADILIIDFDVTELDAVDAIEADLTTMRDRFREAVLADAPQWLRDEISETISTLSDNLHYAKVRTARATTTANTRKVVSR